MILYAYYKTDEDREQLIRDFEEVNYNYPFVETYRFKYFERLIHSGQYNINVFVTVRQDEKIEFYKIRKKHRNLPFNLFNFKTYEQKKLREDIECKKSLMNYQRLMSKKESMRLKYL